MIVADPKPRADGRCVQCEKRRQPPAKKGTNRAALQAWERDVFCSTECAKRYYRVEIRESDGHFIEEREHDYQFEEPVPA